MKPQMCRAQTSEPRDKASAETDLQQVRKTLRVRYFSCLLATALAACGSAKNVATSVSSAEIAERAFRIATVETSAVCISQIDGSISRAVLEGERFPQTPSFRTMNLDLLDVHLPAGQDEGIIIEFFLPANQHRSFYTFSASTGYVAIKAGTLGCYSSNELAITRCDAQLCASKQVFSIEQKM